MGHKKRRTFSAEFKFEIVLEALRGEKTAVEICRARDINENLLSRWKQEFVSKEPEAFEKNGQRKSQEQDERVAELERLVGRQALELEILKSWGLVGIELERKQAMIGQLKDNYPIERLCEVLDWPCSSYYYQPGESNDRVLRGNMERTLQRWPFYG